MKSTDNTAAPPVPRCTVCGYALLGSADKQRGQCRAHCGCGHPLWAPLSIKRGTCEGCRINIRREEDSA